MRRCWRRSSARVALAASLVALAASCGDARRAPPLESAILITLDTTRADALSCYGGPAGATPHIAALARESRVYDQARTVVPLTLPAHASMLTGATPLRHRVRDNSLDALPQSADTIAERARERGLSTAAFVSAVVLDRAFGTDQGFDTYDQPPRTLAQTTSHAGERSAADTIAAAQAWLAARDRTRGFLLWIHLFDAHAPYAPPADCLAQAGGDAYLGEIAAQDRALGALLDGLRADGTLARTLVVLTADHGESLGEHGEATHGAYCYDATLRVPLLVRDPASAGRGDRDAAPVGVIDVGPTIAEALDLRALDADGVSLFRRAAPPSRRLYFESYYGYLSYGWSPLAGCFDERAKYIHSSQPELYDLASDPRELRDVHAERATDVPRYVDAIAAAAARPAFARAESDRVDAAMLERLRAVGYTGGGAIAHALPGPLDASALPSPRARADELARTLDALGLSDAGRHAEAVEPLRAIAAANPRNYVALERLGNALVLLGRHAEAVAPLEALCANGPQWAGAHYNLGVALYQSGRQDAGLDHFRRAVALDPGHVQALDALAKVLEARGARAEAAEFRAALERVR
ncbi:MAG: tetratricopeptide repeat protein [Planctomycetota bacterium]|nr:MAG: tetratricopeptide repeat protein [Planctomycetota bacterium]